MGKDYYHPYEQCTYESESQAPKTLTVFKVTNNRKNLKTM